MVMDLSTLIQFGALLGGVMIGAIGAVKLPITRPNNKQCSIEVSKLTGGALHISEEGLTKYNCIERKVREGYLTEQRHGDLCAIERGETKLFVKEELEEMAEKVSGKVVETVSDRVSEKVSEKVTDKIITVLNARGK